MKKDRKMRAKCSGERGKEEMVEKLNGDRG